MKPQEAELAAKRHRLKIAVTSTVALSLAIVLLVPTPVVLGTTCEVGTWGLPLLVHDFSVVPQPIVEDATRIATELFGDYQKKCDQFVKQLLATYMAAKDRDFVIIFNAGGWGWTPVEKTPGWQSICDGIKSELDSLGYSSLFLNYQRTVDTPKERLVEIMSMISFYPSRAKELAARVEFLTSHIPDLRVIITGESGGTIICDRVMNILKDNRRVYSIQAGPPFWHKNTMTDRTLVIKSNGIVPDSLSYGDLFTIIRSNLEALFGVYQEAPGKILLYIGAPGHDYGWHYDEVRSQITDFLHKYFDIDITNQVLT